MEELGKMLTQQDRKGKNFKRIHEDKFDYSWLTDDRDACPASSGASAVALFFFKFKGHELPTVICQLSSVNCQLG